MEASQLRTKEQIVTDYKNLKIERENVRIAVVEELEKYHEKLNKTMLPDDEGIKSIKLYQENRIDFTLDNNELIQINFPINDNTWKVDYEKPELSLWSVRVNLDKVEDQIIQLKASLYLASEIKRFKEKQPNIISNLIYEIENEKVKIVKPLSDIDEKIKDIDYEVYQYNLALEEIATKSIQKGLKLNYKGQVFEIIKEVVKKNKPTQYNLQSDVYTETVSLSTIIQILIEPDKIKLWQL